MATRFYPMLLEPGKCPLGHMLENEWYWDGDAQPGEQKLAWCGDCEKKYPVVLVCGGCKGDKVVIEDGLSPDDGKEVPCPDCVPPKDDDPYGGDGPDD